MFYHALYVITSLSVKCVGNLRLSERFQFPACKSSSPARGDDPGIVVGAGFVCRIVHCFGGTPVLIPLALSIPVAAIASSPLWDNGSGHADFFLVPEEQQSPTFKLYFEEALRRWPQCHPILKIPLSHGFVLAVLDLAEQAAPAAGARAMPISHPPGNGQRRSAHTHGIRKKHPPYSRCQPRLLHRAIWFRSTRNFALWMSHNHRVSFPERLFMLWTLFEQTV